MEFHIQTTRYKQGGPRVDFHMNYDIQWILKNY